MEKENNMKMQKKKMKKKEENIGTLSMKQNMQKNCKKTLQKTKMQKKYPGKGRQAARGEKVNGCYTHNSMSRTSYQKLRPGHRRQFHKCIKE